MLPPILEIYVVWHPDDADGAAVAKDLASHFHGGCYANMLGGAVEVYARSAGWQAVDDAPRPIVWPSAKTVNGDAAAATVAPAQYVAVVPVIGLGLLRAANREGGPWDRWLQEALAAAQADPAHVTVLPLRLPGVPLQGRLAAKLPATQLLAEPDPHTPAGLGLPLPALRRRDLVQALARGCARAIARSGCGCSSATPSG